MKRIPSVRVDLAAPLPDALVGVFQKGLEIEVELGTDLVTLLRSELCLTDQGIERIQTIFWQGKPVDDLERCRTEHGGVLALSAALPGLVGACLRRGGAWAPLRSSISHADGCRQVERRRGAITVKLFNFMLREVGPLLLERGVLMTPARLADLLALPEVRQVPARIELDGRVTEPAGLAPLQGAEAVLQVSIRGPG